MGALRKIIFIIVKIFLGFSYFACGEIRIDCHPDRNGTRESCLKRNCLWKPVREWEGRNSDGAPWCIFDWRNLKTMVGYDAVLKRRKQTAILTRRATPSLFGKDMVHLSAKIMVLSDKIIRIRISPRKQPDKEFHPRIRAHRWRHTVLQSGSPEYKAVISRKPFGFKVFNISNPSDAIFDSTNLPGFTFSEQFVQITTRVSTGNVYGFGEQYHTELRRNFSYKRLSLFTHDVGPNVQGLNMYSFQPFYMGLNKANKAYGVFLHNTHPMDIYFQPNPDLITFRVIGGNIDFFFFLGPTPDNVVEQYTSLIGRPMMPPYWSLGFQLSRFGYRNLSYLQTVWNRNRRAGIPQDVQIIDIDYMDEKKDFTYASKDRFKGLPQFLSAQVHGTGRKFVPIVDPGILGYSQTPYEPLTEGLRRDIFIKDNRTKKPFVGRVWPGPTVWPDFTNPKAATYWRDMLLKFHQLLKFDGIWLDMMDPSNFVTGALKPEGCENNSLNNPPFVPTPYKPIYKRTVCLDAIHHTGYHYQWHNYYGFYEAVATNYALRAVFPGKRPFILSRSTSPGSGAYTSHWSGDNHSAWSQLKHSLIVLLEFNMFGVPFMGSEICGFGGTSWEELCLRWYQVGAFYSYSRNHNDLASKVDQDPAAWPPETAKAIRKVLLQRYALLPYLYTLFYHAHVNGTTVIRPMFFEFPDDHISWNMHDQFLWGSHLLVAPILEPNSTERRVYFHQGEWYNTNENFSAVPQSQISRSVQVHIPKDSIGLFVRGGGIIPWQFPAVSTAKSRLNSFGLAVALDTRGRANGDLFWDDGESSSSIRSEKYCSIDFTAENSHSGGQVVVRSRKSGCERISVLSDMWIAGVKERPKQVFLGKQIVKPSSVYYDDNAKCLFVYNLGIRLKNVIETLRWQIF